jgi:hypothetical protein
MNQEIKPTLLTKAELEWLLGSSIMHVYSNVFETSLSPRNHCISDSLNKAGLIELIIPLCSDCII